MKGLLKVLSPFAPDQSGAAAVFYDMGCITVICDAGGCTGNICGFDEPRWFESARPIFSAGLRDMDAILGRDDRLIHKLKLVCEKVDADFAAIIGTPVPAVIATDMRALKRMAEKKCEMPIVTCECDGTKLYDAGEEEAYMQLLDSVKNQLKANDESGEASAKRVLGVFGATPLNLSSIKADELIREYYREQGFDEVHCYGMGAGREELMRVTEVEKIVVIAPSGLKPARYLEKNYGIPFEIAYPIVPTEVAKAASEIKNAKVLIIHQQVSAEELRKNLERNDCEVNVASFFEMDKEYTREGDAHIETEEEFIEFVEAGNYDYIFGDALLKRAIARNSYKDWVPFTHFAVSGNLEESICAL